MTHYAQITKHDLPGIAHPPIQYSLSASCDLTRSDPSDQIHQIKSD